MLKQENVSVLGGEVDSLMEANTPENILKSTLYVILYHKWNLMQLKISVFYVIIM